VRDPGLHDLFGSSVVPKRFEKNLPAAVELTTKNPVWTVRFVQSSPAVLDVGSEISRRMLVLKALDSFAIGALEQETDHQIRKASLDEIVDDGSQLRFSTELVE
jgi:hypothetical protein